ncbi:proton-conducting transporter transmembrane domain-containing protein [Bacillus tuaregi]|uniref:proton-conducting transporter transmembrane domain-containing protein n=1 Tax=Bacillus tuaregi TaxID=1816695 RepID=UPI000A0689C2|nr:proton-conducting transporter membrane subunit [Bacillus tuaregi]
MNTQLLFGAMILLLFEVMAVMKPRKITTLLVYSTIAELGYILLGFASGTFVGQTGGLLHLEYQLIMRGLVFLTVFVMIQQSKTSYIENLKGFGRTSPLISTMFAFGIFSVMGLSPFKGSISKFLIVYSCIEAGQMIYAAAAIVGSIIEAWYFIRILHHICFAEDEKTEQDYGKNGDSIVLNKMTTGAIMVLGGLTALSTLFPEPFIEFSERLVGSLFATAVNELPVIDSPWPVMVLVPYIGAFVVFIIGHYLPSLRGLLAMIIGVTTVGVVWMDGTVDSLSKLFALIISVMTLLAIIYSIGYFRGEKHNNRYFFFLLLTLGSLIGVATSTKLGNFYVFWELMTWASYLLIIHEPSQKTLKAGFLYFMMCTSGAYIMQFGILSLQNSIGTLDMAVVSQQLPMMAPGLLIAIIVMFVIGTAVKTGLVPVHSWLPEAHPQAPSPVSALLSGILTKIGIYGLLRVVFVVFGMGLLSQLGSVGNLPYTGLALTLLGIITALYGEIMALRQKDIKRLLAFSTMGQIGEIVTVLGLGTYLGMVAGLYHILNHAMMKGLLFLAAGLLVHKLKSRDLAALKGAGKVMPITAGCLAIGVLAIMGLPPFNGFISKFLMLYAAVDSGYWYIAALLLFGSILAAIYYIRLIKTIFFEKYEGPEITEGHWTMLLPIGVLAGFVIFNGFLPQYALKLVISAADTIAELGGLVITSIPQIQVSWPMVILIPMLGGLLAYFFGKGSAKTAGWISVFVMMTTLGTIVLSHGKYDVFSLSFALLIAFVGLLNMLYSLGYMGHGHAQNRYYLFFLMMIAGLIGVAVSSDFFSFFLYWEIMSSWTLYFSIIHEETREALKEGFKYFIFNYIGASFAFLGILLLTAKAGTFDMSLLANRLGEMELGVAGLGLTLITIGFLMKAAILSFRIDYQMHPATAPTPVSGYISSVLLKSAPYSLIKLFFIMRGAVIAGRMSMVLNSSILLYIVAWIAGLTIVGAGAMALVQRGIKRLLIYSTVSQIAYIILGLALGTTLGLTGALLHFVNHMFFKDLLFLAAGAIMVQAHCRNLDDVSGLGRKMPWTLGFFMVGALSLAGVPPFSGFTSKWIIYEAAMEQGEVLLAILSLAGSAMTMAYFVKFMHSAFFGVPTSQIEQVKEAPWTMLVPMGLLSVISVVFGIMPGLPLMVISKVLALAGFAQPSFTLFRVDTPIGTWQVGVITIAILLGLAVGLVLLLSGNKKVRYTDAYTCGVTDLDADSINPDAQNLYETPTKLVKKLHQGIVPVFGNGEEEEE